MLDSFVVPVKPVNLTSATPAFKPVRLLIYKEQDWIAQQNKEDSTKLDVYVSNCSP